MAWYDFPPYVPAAERRRRAAQEVAKRKKMGLAVEPVVIAGRAIASSFWGKAWCAHLEGYSDYENRLPRGRTYVRNGSVLHLSVAAGRIDALVQGTSLYAITVDVKALDARRWKAIVGECAGQIDTLVELLRGKVSGGVMRVVTDRDKGLFPAPRQIDFECSCPDSASMCKHVAAVLYGIGARLDDRPELLFRLRKVDHMDLVGASVTAPSLRARAKESLLDEHDLGDVFGIELEAGPTAGRSRKKSRLGRDPTGPAKRRNRPRGP